MTDNVAVVKSLHEYWVICGDEYKRAYRTNKNSLICYYCNGFIAQTFEEIQYICRICKKEICRDCSENHEGLVCFAKFLSEEK